MGKIEDLEKIEDLKNKGILTQEEFDIEKKKILEQDNKDNIDNPTNTFKNKLKSKKILFTLITLGATILVTIIVLIVIFNKNTEEENISSTPSIKNEDLENKDIVNSMLEYENNMNFLEEIKEKYPTESGMICTNGTDYWLLDEKGDKLYFYDLASFEEALKLCVDYTEEATENQIEAEQPQNDIENSKNNYSNSSSYVDIPSLQGMTEEEAIKKAKELNVPYEIVYREDLSYDKEGIVIGQTTHTKIITDGGGDIVAAYNLTVLYPGETLAIVINKYEDRTVNFDVHIVCLVKQYLEICEKNGKKPQTNEFTFDLKVNNKSIYKETVKRIDVENKIKKALTGTLDQDLLNEEDLLDPGVTDRFMIHYNCGRLKKYTYTGYGVFNFEMSINGVMVRNDKCDLYHTVDGINYIKSNDNNLKGATTYEENDGYGEDDTIPSICISTYDHGGYG